MLKVGPIIAIVYSVFTHLIALFRPPCLIKVRTLHGPGAVRGGACRTAFLCVDHKFILGGSLITLDGCMRSILLNRLVRAVPGQYEVLMSLCSASAPRGAAAAAGTGLIRGRGGPSHGQEESAGEGEFIRVELTRYSKTRGNVFDIFK